MNNKNKESLVEVVNTSRSMILEARKKLAEEVSRQLNSELESGVSYRELILESFQKILNVGEGIENVGINLSRSDALSTSINNRGGGILIDQLYDASFSSGDLIVRIHQIPNILESYDEMLTLEHQLYDDEIEGEYKSVYELIDHMLTNESKPYGVLLFDYV